MTSCFMASNRWDARNYISLVVHDLFMMDLNLPNVNIPETETIKSVWTYQEKRRRQLIKTNYGHGRTVEEKKGAA